MKTHPNQSVCTILIDSEYLLKMSDYIINLFPSDNNLIHELKKYFRMIYKDNGINNLWIIQNKWI